MRQDDLIKQDLKYIWHPCSQLSQYIGEDSLQYGVKPLDKKELLPLIPISKGKGIYLYDFNNKKYIDCVSSWWVNIFGHSNKYIASKLTKQAKKLEHVIFAGFSHTEAIRLSKRLVNLANTHESLKNKEQKEIKNLKFAKCFFADNGSSAIEAALKLSYHYNLLKDKRSKKVFLKLEGAYHGETIGALSMCDVGIYKDCYADLFLDSITLKLPKNDLEINTCLKNLEEILKKHGNDICSFILEPLLQCAGGMNMYSQRFLNEACKMVRDAKILIIFDEIATGFGRLGEMFGFLKTDIIPDFLCLSKGITGGFLPLSVVLTNNKIYKEFLGEKSRAFLHSHSYTGNALACSCANGVLDIFENKNIIAKNKKLSNIIWEKWQKLESFKEVVNIRYIGMVFAFDIESSKFSGIDVYKMGLKYGLILRPLGNTIYLMPPFIINIKDINKIINSLKKILKKLR